jgi:hypothetical protein
MTDLRRKRLLLLAAYGGNHQRWYSQYCKLRDEGLVVWFIGMAFLTESGYQWLRERGYYEKRLQPSTD